MIPEHCGEQMEWWDGGYVKVGHTYKEWNAYKCWVCGHIESTEPQEE